MSNKTLDQMKAPEIVKAIREKDLRVIKILVKDGVKKGTWTQAEISDMVDVAESTISRWVNNAN
jgi:predicted transcriptional regulator